MPCVGDLQRSINFYTNVLGMKLLPASENLEYKYPLVFDGDGDESEEAVIELTYNWGIDSYELGTAYGHIALSVEALRSRAKLFAKMAAPRLSPSLKIQTVVKSN